MALFPTNYHEHTDEPMGAPEPDYCQSGIAPLCTEEPSYLWNGEYVCGYCLTFIEDQIDAKRELTAAENLDARR